MTTNYYANTLLTCNGKTMLVTSNTSNTFNGSGWSGGGTPGDSYGWTITHSPGSYPPSGSPWNTGTGAHRDYLQVSDMGDAVIILHLI